LLQCRLGRFSTRTHALLGLGHGVCLWLDALALCPPSRQEHRQDAIVQSEVQAVELESAMQKPRELQSVLAAFLLQRCKCLGKVFVNLGALVCEGLGKAFFVVAEGLEIFVWGGGRGEGRGGGVVVERAKREAW